MHHPRIHGWRWTRTTWLTAAWAIGFGSSAFCGDPVGKDMGASPVWSERNQGSSSNNNTYSGPSASEIAAQQAELARQQQLNEARDANEQGIAYADKGDWANAVASLQEAVRKNPDHPTMRANLAKAQEFLQAELAAAREKARIEKQDKAAAANMRQAINNFTRTLAVAPPTPATGGLDFAGGNSGNSSASAGKSDGSLDFMSTQPVAGANKPTAALEFGYPTAPTRRGAFGSNESNAKFATAEARTPGNNTRAGDQLKSAAAQAALGGDLKFNYDIGGAPGAGSLEAAHTLSAGPPPMDISRFSERAKKDPEIVASLNNLSELQSWRIQLDAQRTQLTAERNQAKDADKMQKLSEELARKEKDYQANLAAITVKTEQIEKRRRFIDNAVDGSTN